MKEVTNQIDIYRTPSNPASLAAGKITIPWIKANNSIIEAQKEVLAGIKTLDNRFEGSGKPFYGESYDVESIAILLDDSDAISKVTDMLRSFRGLSIGDMSARLAKMYNSSISSEKVDQRTWLEKLTRKHNNPDANVMETFGISKQLLEIYQVRNMLNISYEGAQMAIFSSEIIKSTVEELKKIDKYNKEDAKTSEKTTNQTVGAIKTRDETLDEILKCVKQSETSAQQLLESDPMTVKAEIFQDANSAILTRATQTEKNTKSLISIVDGYITEFGMIQSLPDDEVIRNAALVQLAAAARLYSASLSIVYAPLAVLRKVIAHGIEIKLSTLTANQLDKVKIMQDEMKKFSIAAREEVKGILSKSSNPEKESEPSQI